MDELTRFQNLKLKTTFLVWGTPQQGPRSKALSRELGIDSLHYIYSSIRIAPLKYAYQALKTLRILFRERPQLVFVQSPPSFAVLFVYLYCALTRSRYIADAHSAAFLRIWSKPVWLLRLLARKAITTLVTNEHYQRHMQARGGHAFILRDVPTTFTQHASYPTNGGFNVAVVNTFSQDEPLSEVLAAARSVPEVHLYITGKKKLAPPDMLAALPANVHFTDFLPDESYYGLLGSAHAVMCLTTRNHTMQRGACEALSLGRPIITSDWPLLREYFHKGTVHVTHTPESIGQGLHEMKTQYEMYRAQIVELQIEQRREWEEKIEALIGLIKHAFPSRPGTT